MCIRQIFECDSNVYKNIAIVRKQTVRQLKQSSNIFFYFAAATHLWTFATLLQSHIRSGWSVSNRFQWTHTFHLDSYTMLAAHASLPLASLFWFECGKLYYDLSGDCGMALCWFWNLNERNRQLGYYSGNTPAMVIVKSRQIRQQWTVFAAFALQLATDWYAVTSHGQGT